MQKTKTFLLFRIFYIDDAPKKPQNQNFIEKWSMFKGHYDSSVCKRMGNWKQRDDAQYAIFQRNPKKILTRYFPDKDN